MEPFYKKIKILAWIISAFLHLVILVNIILFFSFKINEINEIAPNEYYFDIVWLTSTVTKSEHDTKSEHGTKSEHDTKSERSEERRVGKECRSRW